jgi:hypothetical protein
MDIEELKRLYPLSEFIVLLGLNNAIIGIQINALDEAKNKLVYSAKKIIKALIYDLDYTESEAIAFYFENIESGYYGENTPVIVYDLDIEDKIGESYKRVHYFSPN